jgi:hypothetical protein
MKNANHKNDKFKGKKTKSNSRLDCNYPKSCDCSDDQLTFSDNDSSVDDLSSGDTIDLQDYCVMKKKDNKKDKNTNKQNEESTIDSCNKKIQQHDFNNISHKPIEQKIKVKHKYYDYEDCSDFYGKDTEKDNESKNSLRSLSMDESVSLGNDLGSEFFLYRKEKSGKKNGTKKMGEQKWIDDISCDVSDYKTKKYPDNWNNGSWQNDMQKCMQETVKKNIQNAQAMGENVKENIHKNITIPENGKINSAPHLDPENYQSKNKCIMRFKSDDTSDIWSYNNPNIPKNIKTIELVNVPMGSDESSEFPSTIDSIKESPSPNSQSKTKITSHDSISHARNIIEELQAISIPHNKKDTKDQSYNKMLSDVIREYTRNEKNKVEKKNVEKKNIENKNVEKKIELTIISNKKINSKNDKKRKNYYANKKKIEGPILNIINMDEHRDKTNPDALYETLRSMMACCSGVYGILLLYCLCGL